jgi:hypothetical protein
MSLLTPLPINYQNAAIEQQTLKGIVHLATVLTESYYRFWNLKPEVNELLGFVSRTPEAIVSDLNADYALANERNTKHYMMATTVNQWLTDAGHALRVPITMPVGYTNDGTAFAYTAPEPEVVIEPEVIVEPEVIIEPEPQPES